MSDNEKENITDDNIEINENNSQINQNNKENIDNLSEIPPKNSESPTEKKEQKNGVLHEIMSWVFTIAGAVILAFIITTFIIVNAVVPTESMETTINAGNRLVAFRLSYLFDDPERFDIVVFKYPDDEDTLFIKRIIGLPGEKVTIKYDENNDVKVYINDSDTPLDDYFIREPMQLLAKKEDMISLTKDNKELIYNVPQDSYFMLGDNRNNSKDSRFWKNTFVRKDKILGKALFKYYPSIEWIDDNKDNKKE